MNKLIYDIVKTNNVIGKGSFGKIYHDPLCYPNCVVKKMKKHNKFENNYILNNVKELWWYSIISDTNVYDSFANIPRMTSYHIDSDYIYLLIEHRGTSIYNKIKEIKELKNSETDFFQKKQKHIELLKLIPLIIYSCSKIFLQLHYACMRHGDITISNILIKDNFPELNKVSIVDWGSIVFNKVILNHYNQCAANFVSPELKFEKLCNFNNINKVSIKSDIFSLGLIILYIIDIDGNSIQLINEHINNSEIKEYQYGILDNILNSFKSGYISEFVDEKTFFILSKMIEIDPESRIDIDSLYSHELFSQFRKKDEYYSDLPLKSKFDKFYLRNLLVQTLQFSGDSFKKILVEKSYDYLKKFKSRDLKPLLDSRLILLPSVKLFYRYINSLNLNLNLNVKSDSNVISDQNTNDSFVYYSEFGINKYIVSFLCSVKWIDIIINDDISIYHLYEYYTFLYNKLSNQFPENIMLDITNFLTLFDITFYLIFKKLNGFIFIYPEFMDFNYDYIDYGYIKKLMIKSDNF